MAFLPQPSNCSTMQPPSGWGTPKHKLPTVRSFISIRHFTALRIRGDYISPTSRTRYFTMLLLPITQAYKYGHPKDGGSTFLRNVEHLTTTRSRTPRRDHHLINNHRENPKTYRNPMNGLMQWQCS